MAVQSLVGNKHDFLVNEPCQNEIRPLLAEEKACFIVGVMQDGSKTRDDFGVSLQIGGNEEQGRGIMFNKVIEFTGLSESKVLGVQLEAFEPTRVSNDKSFIRVADIHKNSVASVDGRLKIGDRIVKVNGNSLTGLSTNEAGQILEGAVLSGDVSLTVLSEPQDENSINDTVQTECEAELKRTVDP
ncbi:Multiple PDZ domain, partial [Paramuricea clavata]